MGLLEKALEYKKEINRKGKTTLIDTIKGPAETEIVDSLFELPEDDNTSPFPIIPEVKAMQEKNNYEDFYSNDELNKKTTKTDMDNSAFDLPDPLTAEDDPVIPKDINVIAENTNYKKANAQESRSTQDQNAVDNIERQPEFASYSGNSHESEEILEVEPYIIPDDNSDAEKNPELEMESVDSRILFDENKDEPEDNQKHEINITRPRRLNFSDNTLYEIGKEISKSETKKSLFEVVIFSVMGQVAASNTAIMMKNPENDKWVIVNSSGLKSVDRTISFDASNGILRNIKKDFIDIEKFKNDKDYPEFKSIGARLFIPWYYKGKILGILILGDKITDDDYSEEELNILQGICEASAVELNKINTYENLKYEIENSKTDLVFLHRLNNIQEKINTSNRLKIVKDIIKSELEEIGIISYSVIINDPAVDKYIAAATSGNEIHDSQLFLGETNPFISYLKKIKNYPRIDDFKKKDIISEAFKETEIKKMPLLWIFPFQIGDQLLGFMAIFNVKDKLLDENKKTEINNNFDKLSKMIISNLINIIQIDPDETRHTDHVEKIFKRINSELVNAKALNIPLSLLVFSIKNFKRYGNVLGYQKAKELIDHFSRLIKSRLSDTDFSARFDRNKIIVVLPGKDKKFATSIANSVRNELLHGFKETEMPLLITFLISEYPEDGDNLLALTDAID